jgi:hypothetical protein
MSVKSLTDAAFDVWGEHGTKRRFLRFRHGLLPEPVTFLLEERTIAQLIHALQTELQPEAYTSAQSVP